MIRKEQDKKMYSNRSHYWIKEVDDFSSSRLNWTAERWSTSSFRRVSIGSSSGRERRLSSLPRTGWSCSFVDCFAEFLAERTCWSCFAKVLSATKMRLSRIRNSPDRVRDDIHQRFLQNLCYRSRRRQQLRIVWDSLPFLFQECPTFPARSRE